MTVFKKGDKVLISKIVPKQDGWKNTWNGEMTKRVGDGRVYTIARISQYGVSLNESNYNWPTGALELFAAFDDSLPEYTLEEVQELLGYKFKLIKRRA